MIKVHQDLDIQAGALASCHVHISSRITTFYTVNLMYALLHDSCPISPIIAPPNKASAAREVIASPPISSCRNPPVDRLLATAYRAPGEIACWKLGKALMV